MSDSRLLTTTHFGVACSARWMTLSKDKFQTTTEQGVCPLCKNPLLKGQKVILLINNYQLFPNRIVHESCSNTYSHDDKDLYTVHQILLSQWRMAQQYADWF